MNGRIVSTKMKNTVTVLVERVKKHPLYQKTYRYSKKYLAEDPLKVQIGDLVEIVKVRPISKNKHFKVTKVLGRSVEEEILQELKEEAAEVIEEVMPEEKEAISSMNNELSKKDGDQNKKGGRQKEVVVDDPNLSKK